jgi:hypothetical protein
LKPYGAGDIPRRVLYALVCRLRRIRQVIQRYVIGIIVLVM